jgi:hypothetical protein
VSRKNINTDLLREGNEVRLFFDTSAQDRWERLHGSLFKVVKRYRGSPKDLEGFVKSEANVRVKSTALQDAEFAVILRAVEDSGYRGQFGLFYIPPEGEGKATMVNPELWDSGYPPHLVRVEKK